MEINKAVTERILCLITIRGWTTKELIRRTNINQFTISEILMGHSKYLSIDTLNEIANGFGITLSEFFDDPLFLNPIND